MFSTEPLFLPSKPASFAPFQEMTTASFQIVFDSSLSHTPRPAHINSVGSAVTLCAKSDPSLPPLRNQDGPSYHHLSSGLTHSLLSFCPPSFISTLIHVNQGKPKAEQNTLLLRILRRLPTAHKAKPEGVH